MDRKVLRNGAFAVGAGVIAAAIGAAVITGDPRPAPVKQAPSVAGPVSAATDTIAPPVVETPTQEPAAAEEPVFETAAADAPSEIGPPSFLVRFAPTHELGRAQALSAQGRDGEARRRAEAVLRTQRNLRGLCFDRFTLGGAEIVLRPCADVPAQDRNQFRQSWILRLRAMDGVDYADANLPAQPDTDRR